MKWWLSLAAALVAVPASIVFGLALTVFAKHWRTFDEDVADDLRERGRRLIRGRDTRFDASPALPGYQASRAAATNSSTASIVEQSQPTSARACADDQAPSPGTAA